jgi:hypothetical protein
MAAKFMNLVLTPAVQAAQDHYFGRHQVVDGPPERDPFTLDEAAFIASRDSFYLATTNKRWLAVYPASGRPGGLSKSARAAFAGLRGFQRQPAVAQHR